MLRPILEAVSILSVLCLASLVAPFAHAGIYKCTDADGNVTYAQAPCPNQKTETIRSSVKTPEPTPADLYTGTYASSPVDRVYPTDYTGLPK